MKNIKIAIITFVLIIVVGIAGFFLFKYSSNKKTNLKLTIVLTETKRSSNSSNPDGPNMGYIIPGGVNIKADEKTTTAIFGAYPDAQSFVVTLSVYQDNNLVKEFSHKHEKDSAKETGCYSDLFVAEREGLSYSISYTTKLKIQIADDVIESEEIELSMDYMSDYTYTYSVEQQNSNFN